jgi:hypothetical protein
MFTFFHTSDAQSYGDESSVAIHGFISQGYMQSTDNNFFGNTIDGTFKFNEFGLNITSQVSDNLRIGMQLFSRNLGYLGGPKVIVDWAYGDYLWKDWLGVRAGKIKMPLGFYNETRDVDILRTSIFLPQGVYNESWRTTFNAIQGVGLYGNLTFNNFGTLNYQGQIGIYGIINGSGFKKITEDQMSATVGDYHVSTTYVGSITWETPLEGLRIGASGYLSELNFDGTTNNSAFWENVTSLVAWKGMGAVGPIPPYQAISPHFDLVDCNFIQEISDIKSYWLSGEYIWNDLTLAGEYFNQTGNITTTVQGKTPAGNIDVKMEHGEVEMYGFYGMANYHFNDWLDIASYYTEYYPKADDKDGYKYSSLYNLPASNNRFKDGALSFKFSLNSNWVAKVEGHKITGTAIMFPSDQPNPQNVAKDWYLFAGKLTFNF